MYKVSLLNNSTLDEILKDREIKKCEMGETCSKHGRGENE
jgi:hypothetical protein